MDITLQLTLSIYLTLIYRQEPAFLKESSNFNIGGTLDPYIYNALTTNEEGRVTRQEKINRFSWQNGQGLGNLSRFNTAISLNLKAKGASESE